ncbi:MAG: hypothetical protein LBD13_07900 [Spirochaetaceae bacterium]|jgi:hypothetical protein|nr:hypothetical protein [Spirochaetaceae bacterium]
MEKWLNLLKMMKVQEVNNMNAKKPQPLPVLHNDGKNKSIQKKSGDPAVNVVRQPAPPSPPPPKAKST